MSENESFIDEVTEEVRRDKLYLFLRKYGWILMVIILAIIFGSVFLEVRSNSMRTESEKAGDVVSEVLKVDSEYTKTISDELSTLISSKPFIGLMLEAKILENKSDIKSAITVYEAILKIQSIPDSLKDFVKFKLLLLVKDDPIRIEKILAELINPDSAFTLLALEQKILINISNNDWKEAISNLNLLLADPGASQAMIARATQIKKAIKLGGS